MCARALTTPQETTATQTYSPHQFPTATGLSHAAGESQQVNDLQMFGNHDHNSFQAMALLEPNKASNPSNK